MPALLTTSAGCANMAFTGLRFFGSNVVAGFGGGARSVGDGNEGSSRHDGVRVAQPPNVHQDIKRCVTGYERGKCILFVRSFISVAHLFLARRDADGIWYDKSSHLLLDETYLAERENDIGNPAEDVGVEADVVFGYVEAALH